MSALERVLTERYRCPASILAAELQDKLRTDAGFFRFGPGTVCYARSATGYRRPHVDADLYDVAPDVRVDGSAVYLPFDPKEIIENLRLERYAGTGDFWARACGKKTYYRIRPFLHRSLREQIQKVRLRGWRKRSFPGWPVDFTIENIHEQLLLLILRATGLDRVPFIWFWPNRKEGCVVMTHDVESEAGKAFCSELMDIDDSYGVKASFQLVPQGGYSVSQDLLSTIGDRGFEVGIQDLNHDGRLYDDRKEFLHRATLINRYAKEYGAKGFRAAVLYRNTEWYDAFDFSFDMSIPNTAHLDPQRGGCCTVFPYFIGDILELPVTTTQDYMLFYLLGERSIQLWKTQTTMILNRNGLITFIVHPDYVLDNRMKTLYENLLSYLREIRVPRNLWVTLPSEVDRWWRQRSRMQLVPSGTEWCVEGEGAERATIAYARNVDGTLVYEFEPTRTRSCAEFTAPTRKGNANNK